MVNSDLEQMQSRKAEIGGLGILGR
jgi:hypothetical protein